MSNEKLTKEGYVEELTGQKMPAIEEKKDKKILCLVGTAFSRHLAPYDNPNAEIWGVGHCILLEDVKRMDKVIETHLPSVYETEISPFSGKPIICHANKENRLFGREGDVNVVVSQENKRGLINKWEIFPQKYLAGKYKDLLPPSDQFYATNSIAYMIVWALDKYIEDNSFDELHLYGIHLETNTEWQFERPCNEYWLGVLTGYALSKGKKGIIYLPPHSDVLRNYHEYGYADIEVKRQKYQGKIEFFDKSIRDLTNQRMALAGRIGQLMQERGFSIDERIKRFTEQKTAIETELAQIEKIGKEDYTKAVLQKINEELQKADAEGRAADCRISAFNGAREQLQYHLLELNA